MLDAEDFQFGYKIEDEVLRINHLWVNPEHRGNGSYILETLVRVAHYQGCDVVEVSIGGGERAEAFLKKNGFHIIRRRGYPEDTQLPDGGGYGIDAVRKL